MNDAFCVTLGCFCMWSCFNELLHDLACLEEFDDFDEEQDMFLRSSLFDDFTLFLLAANPSGKATGLGQSTYMDLKPSSPQGLRPVLRDDERSFVKKKPPNNWTEAAN